MSRRLLALATAALAAITASGCADDVAPAAQVGDVRITESELLDEVEEWAGSAALLGAVQFPADLVKGAGVGGADDITTYSTDLVDFVLGSRVSFEVHHAELERRDLEVPAAVRNEVSANLFGPQTEQTLADVSPDYAERLIEDVAVRVYLQDELGEGYEEWLAGAIEAVEVNPRFGAWNPAAAQVVPPTDPAAPAASALAP